MNCAEARLRIGAAPRSSAAEVGEHLAGCPACQQFLDEMLSLEGRIERALAQPPAARAAPPRHWRQWALAASLLMASLALVAVWLLRPTDTLARDLVTHVKAEPESWLAERQVSADGIAAALRGAGVTLELTSDHIVYAQSCWFHGHYVPHLVLQTAQGPATVLILRHEQVASARSFREGGLHGIVVPAQHGSIAVLARDAGERVDLVAQQMQQDMHWLPEPR
ncbi:MAG TPA: DUF3379 family protein [Steroidobacteraceae bacterium]|nr:DUF3379 family protein [Steroidobacteraceae bacterium]